MIDGENIRRNARKKARELYEMTSVPMLQGILNEGKISQTEFEKWSQSHLRGSLKSMNIKFKSGNLDQIAMESIKFRELQRLLSSQTIQPFDDSETLQFLNDCFMIDNTFEHSLSQNAIIDKKTGAFLKKVDLLVFGVLCDLAKEFEEVYLLELENKANHNTLKLLRSNERHSMHDCYNGNLPFDTDMQVS